MDTVEEIKELFEQFCNDASKFHDDGVKKYGTVSRNGAQSIIKKLGDYRKETLAVRKEMDSSKKEKPKKSAGKKDSSSKKSSKSSSKKPKKAPAKSKKKKKEESDSEDESESDGDVSESD